MEDVWSLKVLCDCCVRELSALCVGSCMWMYLTAIGSASWLVTTVR